MDLEQERERQRRSYSASWIGFALITLMFVVSTLFQCANLLLMLSGQFRNVGNLLGIDSFDFYYSTFRTWTRLLGCLMLWSAWNEPSWRRRSGLLVMMSMADVVLWSTEHGVRLGFLEGAPGHDFFRQSLYLALGWPRFALFASLAANFAEHVGYARAGEFAKAVIRTSMTGGIVWFLYFLYAIDWTRPWPLVARRFDHDLILLYLSFIVLSTMCLVQSTLLCALATRSAGMALREMRNEDKRAHDPWTAESIMA
jgi:hypothetical protein